MLRYEEEWYNEVIVPDPSGRRGLWCRITPHNAWGLDTLEEIELCAGREGDDAYVSFKSGDAITEEHIRDLDNVLSYVSWADELRQTYVPPPIEAIKSFSRNFLEYAKSYAKYHKYYRQYYYDELRLKVKEWTKHWRKYANQ